MLPSQIAKESESSHQKAFFAWCAVAALIGFEAADEWAKNGKTDFNPSRHIAPEIPALKWIHAIPNGGSRGDNAKSRSIRGAQLKAEGVKDGIHDVFLPAHKFPYCGLYIEFKKPDLKPKNKGTKGGLSKSQLEFKAYALGQGYECKTAYSWWEGVEIVKEYLTQK